MILILAGVYDFSADLVLLQLAKAGVSYLRLNREQFGDYRFSLDPTVPELYVRRDNRCWRFNESKLCVWYRQPIYLRNTPAEPLSPQEQLARSQWMAFLRAMCVFDEAGWMNAPHATFLAECKPYQLLLAKQVGFDVPRTLIGNDAETFNRSFALPLVVKSLDTVLVRDGDDLLFSYTGIRDLPFEDVSTASAPFIAQDFICPKTDVRVTVVGSETFATRILSEGRPVRRGGGKCRREIGGYCRRMRCNTSPSKCLRRSRTSAAHSFRNWALHSARLISWKQMASINSSKSIRRANGPGSLLRKDPSR